MNLPPQYPREIDELLRLDQVNTATVMRLLGGFSTEFPHLLPQPATLYDRALSAIEDSLRAVSREEHFTETATLSPRAVQSILLLKTKLLYLMAVTDLLRLRLTAPFCYLRLQCESLGLVALIGRDPQVARDWQLLSEPQESRRFFERRQSEIKDAMRSLQLVFPYDNASRVALHVRLAGLASNLRFETTVKGGTALLSAGLSVQEMTDPPLIILLFFHLLRVQETILVQLGSVLDWVDDLEERMGGLDGFRERIERVRQRIRQVFPSLIEGLEGSREEG